MPLPRVIPALADLTQDIAGPLPVKLLQDWATGAGEISAAKTLLSPYQTEGTVVSTDTSGLTHMTEEMDLLDVLSVISQPKEIIHALGCEVGGRAIGTWIADNSEMFYPPAIGPETVIDAMGEVQFRIQERLRVRIGMCVHTGSFYEIGGGLYGGDADLVEYLAENCAGPGEILLTDKTLCRLQSPALLKPELKVFESDDSREEAWLVGANRRMPALEEKKPGYPHPFPADFFLLLQQLTLPAQPGNQAAALKNTALKESIYSQWLREHFVVFVARHRAVDETAGLADLLDHLVIDALMDAVVQTVAPQGTIASSAGGLAICTFNSSAEALGYARAVQSKLADNGIAVRIGIDAGQVLLFRNPTGPSGISGDPINIASKLSEDVGRTGFITISDRAARELNMGGLVAGKATERFEISVSGVSLTGIVLSQ